MNSIRTWACWIIFWAPTLVASAQSLVVGKPWGELSDREPTPLGRAVLNAGKPDWVHAESARFVFHADSAASVEEIAGEAEFAYLKVDDLLGTNSVVRKGHVFVVERRAIWEKVLQGSNRRNDSVAMQLQNDLFVLKETNSVGNVLRVPHEMVHLRLWQQYGNRTPVWLDEGLAAYIGWKVAVAAHALRDKQLVRAPPYLKREHLISLEQLTSATVYPPGSEEGAAFYVEAELCVSAIARKIGDDKLADFVKAVAGDGVPWNEFLRERFSFADSDFAWLEQQIGKYASQ
jgi:hypothetical protein